MPDRYSDPDPIPHTCWGGWATPPDSDAPRRCPICRPAKPPAVVEYEPANVSERARAAIERDEQR